MKVFQSVIFLLLVGFFVNSCDKTNDQKPVISGEWRIAEVNRNDHWGAPLYWKEVAGTVEVKFTDSGEYYRKEGQSSFVLEGSYKVLTDGILEIRASGGGTSYKLDYVIENSQLVLGTGRFEGVVAERYHQK